MKEAVEGIDVLLCSSQPAPSWVLGNYLSHLNVGVSHERWEISHVLPSRGAGSGRVEGTGAESIVQGLRPEKRLSRPKGEELVSCEESLRYSYI